MSSLETWSVWTRFWHKPVRAERLAVTRILLALALLTDQMFQYAPHFADFFGPGGVAPDGLLDRWALRSWRWTVLFFGTDNLAVLYPTFGVWVACSLGLLVGWHTRVMNVAVWFLTACFLNRNQHILNGGDDTLIVGLFLLMLMPSGHALSLDARRWRRRHAARKPVPLQLDAAGSTWTPAWGVRVLQIQLCVIYLTTGLAKLVLEPGTGTWWQGTSIHYVLNYVTMSRWSFAQLPVPFWLTAALTYVSVWWEVVFPLLVLSRRTRWLALGFGVLFHVGIWLTIEVGWFSFYTLALYGVWIPGEFWDRLEGLAGRLPVQER